MKYANGNASTAQVAVTPAAIPTVRQITPRNGPLSKIWRKLAKFQAWTTLPVNESTLQNA